MSWARRPRPWQLAVLVVRLAFRSIASHPGRAVLTLVGSILGVFGMVTAATVLIALSTTIRAAVLEYGPGVVSVQQGNRGDEDRSRFPPLTPELATVLRARSKLARSISVERWEYGQWLGSGARDTGPTTIVVGGGPETLGANSLRLAAGRFLIPADVTHERDVVVLASGVVERLFPDGDALGRTVELAGRPLLVVGVLAPALGGARNDFAFLPLGTFEDRLGRQPLSITVEARDPNHLADTVREVRDLLREARRLPAGSPDDFLIVSNDLAEAMLRNLMLALGAALGALSLISLVVGGIGLANITLASVGRRTREIGVLMAIGARPRAIWTQFLTEAVVLAFCGGAVGLLLSVGIAALAGAILGVEVATPSWAIILAFGASGLTGLLAGAYPASVAARFDPVEALRQDA